MQDVKYSFVQLSAIVLHHPQKNRSESKGLRLLRKTESKRDQNKKARQKDGPYSDMSADSF